MNQHEKKSEKRTVLVTGGAGYIGAFACKALLDKGYLPVTYDNLSTGHKQQVRFGPFVQADLEDKQTLEKTLHDYSIDTVMHFAASALVIESMHNPALYYCNNVKNTIILLESMRKHGIKKLIFSSSCATYGLPQTIPMTEEHPQNPINPYGRTKWMIEQILQDYEKSYGLRYASLRYFNAAGANVESGLGENHANETHIIPLVIETALGLRNRLSVFGRDFPTPDGTAIRDYIHVLDIADAHVKALEWLDNNAASLILNLGTSHGHSILEIIKAVEKISKKEVGFDFKPKREGDPSHLVAGNKKACALLGWEPKNSSLDNIIHSALLWHESLSPKRGPL